jgi:hypothetical protein
MTTAKERVRNFFVGCGRAIGDFARWFANERRQYHEEQRAKKQIAQERSQYYESIEEEGRAYGRGVARGMAEVREQERAIRENERALRKYFKGYDESDTKFNGDFLTEDLEPKKRKKKRSIFDF